MNMTTSRDVLPTGGNRYKLADLPQTKGSTASLADRADVLYRESSDLHGSVRNTRRSANLRDLEFRRSRISQGTPLTEALSKLSDHGFAWRDVARVLGVSVPAVNKWRKGTGVTGENNLKVGKLLALVEMLSDRLVNDPASWLEIPVSEGVALTPMDLLEADRYELVLDLASTHTGDGIVEKVLNEYDPSWRTNLIDDAFESFLADDGAVSIRPRGVRA